MLDRAGVHDYAADSTFDTTGVLDGGVAYVEAVNLLEPDGVVGFVDDFCEGVCFCDVAEFHPYGFDIFGVECVEC